MQVTYNKEVPSLGARIKEARLGSSKSITRLAADAGISVAHWNRIENEKVANLPLDTLLGIQAALGVNLGADL